MWLGRLNYARLAHGAGEGVVYTTGTFESMNSGFAAVGIVAVFHAQYDAVVAAAGSLEGEQWLVVRQVVAGYAGAVGSHQIHVHVVAAVVAVAEEGVELTGTQGYGQGVGTALLQGNWAQEQLAGSGVGSADYFAVDVLLIAEVVGQGGSRGGQSGDQSQGGEFLHGVSLLVDELCYLGRFTKGYLKTVWLFQVALGERLANDTTL